ncbi:hypothetical protein ACFC3F_00280 [Microbacterium sp. NPDC055910]|uniref:hypothetical protein n=1 Tax=Microbacterium sp. NPDC055910 TaxID=3345659 RepID=UPI0035D7A09F
MKVDVKTLDGQPMAQQEATVVVGAALRIAPGFVATTLDDPGGIETTIEAVYSRTQGRYIIRAVITRAVDPERELTPGNLRQLVVQQILQAATPRCIALTLDDLGDPAARWLTLADLTRTEGKIIPAWMATEVTRRGWSEERLLVVQLLYGAAALSGQPPLQLMTIELGIPHRTAGDWVKRTRDKGYLEGLTYFTGRQADG